MRSSRLRRRRAARRRPGRETPRAEAIKDEVSRKGERPENRPLLGYYAAVVRTRDVGRSDEKNGEETSDASLESAWNDDASAFSAEALVGCRVRALLVYRPNGDASARRVGAALDRRATVSFGRMVARRALVARQARRAVTSERRRRIVVGLVFLECPSKEPRVDARPRVVRRRRE